MSHEPLAINNRLINELFDYIFLITQDYCRTLHIADAWVGIGLKGGFNNLIKKDH